MKSPKRRKRPQRYSKVSQWSALCEAVGYVAISWALTERQMDNCTHLIFECLGGDQMEPVKPIALQRKLRFLGKAFRRIPALAPFAESTLKLITCSKKTGESRHAFLHGCVAQLDGAMLTLNKLDPSSTAYQATTINFDMRRDFPALQAELEHLVSEWVALVQVLLETFRPPKPKAPKPPRKASRRAQTRKKEPPPKP